MHHSLKTIAKRVRRLAQRERLRVVDRLASESSTLEQALAIADGRQLALNRGEMRRVEDHIRQIRSDRLRSVASKATSLSDAVALAAVKGISMTDAEMQLVQAAVEFAAIQKTVAAKVYYGSDAAASRSFCSKLEKSGWLGMIAAALFRAQKASSRAKAYRGGIDFGHGGRKSYRDLAYERKDEVLKRLCGLLSDDSEGLTWGWGRDGKNHVARNVLYLDLPQGQVSFHSVQRYSGPDYQGEWDGKEQSEVRILQFCNAVMGQAASEQQESHGELS